MYKMLIIDDSQVNCEMLKQIFAHKYDVRIRENGKEAMDLLENLESDFDIIICDIMMPVMDGFDFLQWIKGNDLLKNIPVVITSAYQEYDNEIKAFDLGAVDVIFKPINHNVLERRIKNVLTMCDSERIKSENRMLRENENLKERLQAIMNGAKCGIFRLRTPIDHSYAKTTLDYANDYYYQIRGISRDQYEGCSYLGGVGKMMPSDETMKVIRMFEEVVKEKKDIMRFETRLIRNTGETRYLDVIAGVKVIGDSYVFDSIEHDITDEKKAQENLYLEKEISSTNNKVFARFIKEMLPDKKLSVWKYDLKTRDAQFLLNPSGFKDTETITPNMPETLIASGEIHRDDIAKFLELHKALDNGAQTVETELRVNQTGKKQIDESEYRLVAVTYTMVYDMNHKPVSAIGISKDITDLNESLIVNSQDTAEKIDKISGLLSRNEFIKQAEYQIAKDQAGALLMIDLDNFKDVNASFGYEFGDKIIDMLSTKMHKTFKSGDILGRIGGDEFAILVVGTETAEAIQCRAQSLCDSMFTQYKHQNRIIEISCSIGISLNTEEQSSNFERMHWDAVSALCQAKLKGKNRVHVYEKEARPESENGEI